MASLNWGMIQDGGVFESLMHAILFAEDPSTILFGRPGQDQGQDARSGDEKTVYQAKYRQMLNMDGAIELAQAELATIKKYRQSTHANFKHWQNAQRWTLVVNLSINPNDVTKWQSKVVPDFQKEGLVAEFWSIETLEGKLAQHSEIRDVFFGGENRVLIGLKEAHDRLCAECVASESLRFPMVGRVQELSGINSFASSVDKRVLPIIGPGGIGKSRLMYESLASLAASGWRVLWALPGSMARSTQWFRLLNGSQQTCVALDDPGDPGLLRAVVEQLAAVERRNWKVIVACRTEQSEFLQRYRTHAMVQKPIYIGALDEPLSTELLGSCLGGRAEPPWAHGVYGLTRGNPGWICLIGELARRGSLSDLPTTADEVAAAYVDSCIASLPEGSRNQARILLRWLSLWGTFCLDAGTAAPAEVDFLVNQGIPSTASRELLSLLIASGLVHNWGIGKRLYAVEPMIVRQQILGQWLLCESAGQYSVSAEGKRLVSQLVAEDVPAVDSALRTLSMVSRSRLNESDAILFMRPFFRAMSEIACDGNLLNQYRVADLIEKAGSADPESALDVLVSVRKNVKDDMDIDAPIWGLQTLTHQSLVESLPWLLFQIAAYVSDLLVARKFLAELRDLVALQDAGGLKSGTSKEPRQLLKRLLRESRNAKTYLEPAYDIVDAELMDPTGWPFVGLLAECLLDPILESVEWVSNWTITIGRRTLLPGTTAWKSFFDLRSRIHKALSTCQHPSVRTGLWRVLSKSHHDIHRAVMHEKIKGELIAQFRSVLVDDLSVAVALLKSPPFPLSVDEVTHAREIWSWYLEYGHEQDPVDLAQECEKLCNAISKWRFHDFFRFDTKEHLRPETARVLAFLRDATKPELLSEFFKDAEAYLNAARHEGQDGADYGRIAAIADGCADLFTPDTTGGKNSITTFVFDVLGRSFQGSRLEWQFTARICQRYIQQFKTSGDNANVTKRLGNVLKLTKLEDRLLWELYSNVHPSSTGLLLRAELDAILAHESGFTLWEWFILLGAFAIVDRDVVCATLQSRLDSLHGNPAEASKLLGGFIRSAYIAALRYDAVADQLPVPWIIDMIELHQLDGNLLDIHDLEWMRDQMAFKMTTPRFVDFMKCRVQMDGRTKPSDEFRSMPYEFDVIDWCRFDPTDAEDRESFQELCELAIGEGFTAIYWMPKYIARLDPAGEYVSDYVLSHLTKCPSMERKQLSRIAYLAAAYPDDSDAWAKVASPICASLHTFSREDRERVYFGLSRKETGVIRSMPGQVADYYHNAQENAIRLRDNEPLASPLRGYREWAVRGAEADLIRQEQFMEEDFHG